MKGKKSFVIYFDAYEQLQRLPDQQLGILFRAMMECARKEAAGEDGITGVEQRYPRMREGTLMAFFFLAATIRRDAQTYAEKCENYRHAARRKAEGRRAETAAAESGGADTGAEDSAAESTPQAKGGTAAPEEASFRPRSAKPAARQSRAVSQRTAEAEAGRTAAWACARELKRPEKKHE